MPVASPRVQRVILLAFVIVIGIPGAWVQHAFAASTEALAVERPLLDVDAMAARMKTDQDIYQKIRDEALTQYAKRNPKPNPYDDKVKTLIRLYAYLWVWNDFYGEGLWQYAVDYAKSAMAQGAQDPFLQTCLNINMTRGLHSDSEEGVREINHAADQFLAGDYPAEFKLWACWSTLDNLVCYRAQYHPDDKSPVMLARDHFVEQWGQNYRELLKQKLPHDLLFLAGSAMQNLDAHDEEILDLAIAEQDRDFNEIDPTNPVRTELDGNFYIMDAWIARGSGYSNTVSDQGWQLFGERLANADKILESLYDTYPNEWGTCYAMMTVELGQGQGRDRMELWFQRAIKADPNSFAAYQSKKAYLLPRWYGSVDDIMAFGRECVATQNWAAKIPMILPIGVAETSGDDPAAVYSRPELWTELEKVYRDYLGHYPNSIFFRTSFAKHAYDGGHKDVAREQFKILANDWDRTVLSDAQYASITADLNSK